jgi:TolA-binding protein
VEPAAREKAAQEMLSQGEGFLARGERGLAKAVFHEVLQRFSGTGCMARAQEHLERLK